jgi:general secretion pathway protein G
MKTFIQWRGRSGFTLIELLIVILIIGILAGLTVGVVKIARRKGDHAQARSMVSALDQGLQMYESDNGYLPGRGPAVDPYSEDANVISDVVEAMREGYARISESDLYVLDVDGLPREATKEEIDDPAIPKLIMDPWGNAYIARENASKEKKEPWMHNKEFVDVYSMGPDGEDDTIEMVEGKDNDDIGNW